ncbi:hypothetical protein HJC23_009816 [Cyclotella cryptica]|uniref:Uncharacterized protein n=1 Tax=Cyclotella cryptica TaxID=29204 RepID=A0ABD3PHX0_9STRA|eukprot:CCRYP_014231-RA/>CCRYP_014231-RA protein AED:0.01 eAED:0.01 QI:122/1/1/1/0/0/2/1425/541
MSYLTSGQEKLTKYKEPREAHAMSNRFRMDTFAATRRCRSPETLISDISDSACSQMQRRNHDMIESPPAFLMNDNGPPSVIYDRGSFLSIDNSMSFQTSYSAAMTEAKTTKTSRTMFTSYSADVTETDSQDDEEYTAATNLDQENSVHLSVIQEDDESGFEVGYEETSSRSNNSCNKHDSEFCGVVRSHEDIDSTKNKIKLGKVDKTLTESCARTSVSVSTDSLTSANVKSGKTTEDSMTLSSTLDSGTKASNGSEPSSKRFYGRGLAMRFEKKTSEQSSTTSLEPADGSKDCNISLFTEETTHGHGFVKFQDEPKEEDNTSNAQKSFEDVSSVSNNNSLKTQQDIMHEHGFEITDVQYSSTSASEYTGALSIFPVSLSPQVYDKSTGEDALDDPGTTGSAIKSDHSDNGLSNNDNTLVEVVRSTAQTTPAMKHRSTKGADHDDTSTVESSLSYLTLSTEALTETSFTSASNNISPRSEPKKFNNWLFSKMFACGPSSTSCEGAKIQKQRYSPIQEYDDSDGSSYESDEQERSQNSAVFFV